MLEKPDLSDHQITACLDRAYGMQTAAVRFLPLGADQNTAVYRATDTHGTDYFLKIRMGDFDSIAVTLPHSLHSQGIQEIIAPLVTKEGQLWTNIGDHCVILYPYIEGRNGYETELTARHWIQFGAALKRIHSAPIPAALRNQIPHETYDPRWREQLKGYLQQVERHRRADPLAEKLADFVRVKRAMIGDIVQRAEALAERLKSLPPEWTVCHSDLHAGNILIDHSGNLYIVDWDNPLLAIKERDLMYVGGAQGFSGHTAEEETDLFYLGYGNTQVDRAGLAYYRYERIIQDIAIFCEQIFSTTEGGEDRTQSLKYLIANFMPNGTIEAAYRTERA